MLLGKRLQVGDTIGLIAPSGASRKPGAVEAAIEETRRMGYQVKAGDSCWGRYGYLAGDDALRAHDINTMFLDDEVDAIVCIRGGYGATRILDKLDYAAIAAHPKIFMGFSDVTALHLALLKECNLVTFHGPMAVSSWSGHPLDDFTRANMDRALTQPVPMGDVPNPPEYARTTVTPGTAEGQIVGGNLSLVVASLGTPWEIDTKGRILFLEDIGEHTYSLDRMLTQLRLAGKFEDCAGIVFGDFADCTIEYPDYGFTLEEIIRDVVVPCGKPILSGLRCGHCTPNLTLPFGTRCRLDASGRSLSVLEAAVR